MVNQLVSLAFGVADAFSKGPALRPISTRKRIFQIRFGDGKIKTIANAVAEPNTRNMIIYLKKFLFGRKRITIPINQIIGWNQYAFSAGKYCFDCPLYTSNGVEIKADQDHILLKLASKISELDKQLSDSDTTIANLRYELNMQRGTTDEAVEKRIKQIANLSEAHAKGSGKMRPMIPTPGYPGEPTNLNEAGDQ